MVGVALLKLLNNCSMGVATSNIVIMAHNGCGYIYHSDHDS